RVPGGGARGGRLRVEHDVPGAAVQTRRGSDAPSPPMGNQPAPIPAAARRTLPRRAAVVQRLSQREPEKSDGGDGAAFRDAVNQPTPLTVSTGRGDSRTTRSATLPRKKWPTPVRPCVAITIESAPTSSRTWIAIRAGSPVRER